MLQYLEEVAADESGGKWYADASWSSTEMTPEVAEPSEVPVGVEPVAATATVADEEQPPFEHGWGRTTEQWRANSGHYGNRGGRHREWYSAVYRRSNPY